MAPVIARLLATLARPLAGMAVRHGAGKAAGFFHNLQRNQPQKPKRRQQPQQQQQQGRQQAPPNQPSVLSSLMQASRVVIGAKLAGAQNARGQGAGGFVRSVMYAASRFTGRQPQSGGQAQGQQQSQQGSGSVLGSLVRYARSTFRSSQRPTAQRGPGIVRSILTTAAASRVQRPDPATMPGLSPKQKLGMMGQSAGTIDAAHRAAQQQQADEEHRKGVQEEQERIVGKLNEGFEKLTLGTGKVVTAFLGLKFALSKFGEGINSLNRDLSPFSGRLNAAFARLDMQEWRLRRQMAGNTETSGTRLADAVQEFRGTNQKNVENFRTGLNTLGLIATKIATGMAYLQQIATRFTLIQSTLDLIEQNTGDAKRELPKARSVLNSIAGRDMFPDLEDLPEL